jgi:RNA polymerase sigma factor (sigma-70 family)
MLARSTMKIEILEGFRRGESEAFTEVVRAYTPMARSITCRFFRGAFQQEEAMQEIWAKAFKQREALDPGRLDKFGAWLKTLARNCCIDLLRKKNREIGPGFKDSSEELEKLYENATQERAAEAAEIHDAVEAFKAKLQPKWRSFFDLHFTQGLDYPEISRRLSISRARCKYFKRVLVRRARRNKRLLEALGRYVHRGGSDAH